MSSLVPVILSGGVGSRLWPLSRRTRPKQLNAILGELTMIQDTALRVAAVPNASEPIVVSGVDYAPEIERQLAEVGIGIRTTITEPVGRNTAPAAAIAAMVVDPADILAILPADHVIADIGGFASALGKAAELAADGALVTFGITPTRPATGYGYIEHGRQLGPGSFEITQFVEKPNRDEAAQFLAAGGFSWNSGMFVVRADTYLNELDTHRPDIASAAKSALPADDGTGLVTLDKSAFAAVPSESIDYAVLEQTARGVVVSLDVGWSDVGSWSTLWELSPKDASGNHTSGSVYLEHVSSSLVSASDRPVAVVGLEGVVVVDTGDAVLVASIDKSEDVKQIVARLAAENRPEV